MPHTSTVPVNAGQRVGLYLREKAAAEAIARFEAGAPPEGRVVLFVHGGSVPSVPDYDLDYQDYSWMGFLAAAGFDTFAMDHTGYGRSPRPAMDDACNMSEADSGAGDAASARRAVRSGLPVRVDHGAVGLGRDRHRRRLHPRSAGRRTGQSHRVVGGGRRTGGYAARHPEKVDRLFLFAPGYSPDGPSEAPDGLPEPGVPMRLQTHETLTQGRWQDNVVCENQVDPGIRDVIWRTILSFDSFGSVWGPPEGVMRVRAGNSSWGWNREYAAKVTAPTLIVVGGAGQPGRARRAARRPDRDRLQGPGDHGLLDPFRGLGDHPVQVHAPGVLRVADRGHFPRTPQWRVSGGSGRGRCDR